MAITLDIRAAWDAPALQTEHLRPLGSVAFLLDWRIEPHPIDAGVPVALARPLASALTRHHDVAFRLFDADDAPATGLRVIPAPQRNALGRIADWLTTSWPVDIAIATDVDATMAMFEQGWDMQSQTALLLARGSGATAPAIDALRTTRDWRHYELTAPVDALVAPATDGWGMLLAARDAATLDRLALDLTGCLLGAGLRIPMKTAGDSD